MGMRPHILLLAGSFEARRVGEGLSAAGLSYAAWLSEAPRGDAQMAQTPLLRRFETAARMQEAVEEGGFTAILDASHTFDRHVTVQAAACANALGLPYLRLERPAWEIEDPAWHAVPDVAAANALIGAGMRVFCATGWESLPAFEDFHGAKLLLRQTRRHARPAPYPFVKLVFGDPPFSASDEQALFAMLGVDMLICRNLGGRASRPKLDAASALGLEVVLIDRPPAPEGITTVAQVKTALEWADAL
ncbi:precorrin-6A/cobalt-precorrin-6A reductase [Sulfitobacter sp. HNIBRBA2951]|uniref:precorrin-6A/cobalt-precorrin-6A reductase n=1 Tax=Sulfitobacter aquimarinus TaxID=3158557 RepID=UPI0032DF76FB